MFLLPWQMLYLIVMDFITHIVKCQLEDVSKRYIATREICIHVRSQSCFTLDIFYYSLKFCTSNVNIQDILLQLVILKIFCNNMNCLICFYTKDSNIKMQDFNIKKTMHEDGKQPQQRHTWQYV